jgi:hypothetical protein
MFMAEAIWQRGIAPTDQQQPARFLKQDEQYVQHAYDLFRQFQQQTQAYHNKCRDNETLWRGKHWRNMRKQPGDPQPVTPILFSTVENMLADIMDNYPEPVLVGEEMDDDPMAEDLQAVVRYILKRRGFRSIYRRKVHQALKTGTSVLEVFWDKQLYGSLGDVNIRTVDIRDFYWDPAQEDIQKGRAVFKATFQPLSYFRQRYPDQWRYIQPDYGGFTRADYVRLDPLDEREQVLMLEHWYRVWDAEQERYRVHMGLLAGGVILFRSEDDEALRERGIYEHGCYPFIVEPLYPIAGEAVGLGMADIFGDLQHYIDKLDQLMLRNILMSASPRMLVNRSADLDMAALADWERNFVEGSRIDEGAVRWFQPQPLSEKTAQVQAQKIERLERDSGQNAFTRGETMGGVTAASGILALQEAGNKRTRLLVDQFYDGFEQLVRMVVELIAENYSEVRYVRVLGERGHMVPFSASRLRLLPGHDLDGRLNHVEFDVQVHAQKQNPYRTTYVNELVSQLAQSNILTAEEALTLMDIPQKDRVLEMVRERNQQQERLEMQGLELERLREKAAPPQEPTLPANFPNG